MLGDDRVDLLVRSKLYRVFYRVLFGGNLDSRTKCNTLLNLRQRVAAAAIVVSNVPELGKPIKTKTGRHCQAEFCQYTEYST
jgi:hypothetical protein